MSNATRTNRLIDFLYECTDSVPTAEILEQLETPNDLVAKHDRNIDALLEETRKKQKLGWMSSARSRLQQFREMEKNVAEKVHRAIEKFADPKELFQAVLNGKLGTDFQNRAQLFNRNKSMAEMSRDDLLSFIADCELLDRLEKDSSREKK